MKDINWGEFTLKQENAKELKLDTQEPKEREHIYLYCCLCFGGVCNVEELSHIADIVYQAYLKNKD